MVDVIRSAEQDTKFDSEKLTKGGETESKRLTEIDIVGQGLPHVDIGIETSSDDVDVSIEIDISAVKPTIIPKVYSWEATYLRLIKPVIKVPALKEVFSSKKHFRIDTRRKAEVRISCMCHEFRHEFLDQEIGPRPGYVVSASKMIGSPMVLDVIDGIGPDYELDLVGLYQIMQRSERRGDVPFSGPMQPNVFFMRNRFGKLRSVGISRRDNGWFISSRTIDPRWGWSLGNVFHLNPQFKHSV